MSDEELEEQAIARYRRDLTREADVARGDLDEIEDHLRALAGELRAGGLPATAAVAEAARRLGEPRSIAREHARVRGAFGAPLSRMRAWSAAGLLAVPLASWVMHLAATGGPLAMYVEGSLSLILLVGLLARLGWARALTLGALPFAVLGNAAYLLSSAGPLTPHAVLVLACDAGSLAFLVPWRRCELSAAGVGLALMAPLYTAATVAAMWTLTAPDGRVLSDPLAWVGAIGALATAGGAILRARWASFSAAIAGVAVALRAQALWPMVLRVDHAEWWRAQMVATQLVGLACALGAAVLLWRTGRSRLGELRYLAR